ncbi:hypothetical protein ELAC_1186 [Estrella lausannensis]|uniref:Uncharacterized protein n=1 Tax=Estrella lausannensis TaxID=483423 RepID=A0A0H5DQX7_9BACT|nr:hypothetical protein ELAC_1186 [Estrella lausannensis]
MFNTLQHFDPFILSHKGTNCVLIGYSIVYSRKNTESVSRFMLAERKDFEIASV